MLSSALLDASTSSTQNELKWHYKHAPFTKGTQDLQVGLQLWTGKTIILVLSLSKTVPKEEIIEPAVVKACVCQGRPKCVTSSRKGNT